MPEPIKTGLKGTKYNYSGMKEPRELIAEGYALQSSSTNGGNLVTAFIASHNGQRVHGHYDYQKARYIQEAIC